MRVVPPLDVADDDHAGLGGARPPAVVGEASLQVVLPASNDRREWDRVVAIGMFHSGGQAVRALIAATRSTGRQHARGF